MTYAACCENVKVQMKKQHVRDFKLQLSLKPALFCGLLSQTTYLMKT